MNNQNLISIKLLEYEVHLYQREREMWGFITHGSPLFQERKGRGDRNERVGESTITRSFIKVYWRCTADTHPHALDSEQRLRRAGRFSPTATWPLPPLSQLE